MQKQILDIKNCRKIAEFENMKTDDSTSLNRNFAWIINCISYFYLSHMITVPIPFSAIYS